MADKQKPVLAGTGSAGISDRGEAFDPAGDKPNTRVMQARLTVYRVANNLVVEDAAYA
jgi:hypothetical protein